MLADYLPRNRAAFPPAPKENRRPPEEDDRLGQDWQKRLPAYRPGIDKADLKRLLSMIVHLGNALADIPMASLDSYSVENMLLESAAPLPETLHALYRHTDQAHCYAQACLGKHSHIFSVEHLPPFFFLNSWIFHTNQRTGLAPGIDSIENLNLETTEMEVGYRYLLSSAVGVHSGLPWAADCLDEYTPEEIQAALLLCPTPYRGDWQTYPLAAMLTDFMAAVRREDEIFNKRKFSSLQAKLCYGRRDGGGLQKFYVLARRLLAQYKVVPAAFHVSAWIARCTSNHLTSSTRLDWAPYILGTLVMALRNALVQRRHIQARSMTPVSFPVRRYQPLPQVEEVCPKPRIPEVAVRVFRSSEAARQGFPEAIGALCPANQGNRFIPYFLVTDTATGFKVMLFPSSHSALELLRNVYGLPRPSLLLRLPPRLERLTDITSPQYGQTLSQVFPSVYDGKRDILPLIQAGEGRPSNECPPADLFHALLLKP